MRVESRPVHQELLEQRPPGLRAAHPAPIRGEIPLPGGCDEQDYVPEDMVRAAAEAANKIASVFNMTVELPCRRNRLWMLQIIDSRTDV